MTKTLKFSLHDPNDMLHPPLTGRVELSKTALNIYLDGYGVAFTLPDRGSVILLEQHGHQARLNVWADVRQEDLTQVVYLTGALETNRFPDEMSDEAFQAEAAAHPTLIHTFGINTPLHCNACQHEWTADGPIECPACGSEAVSPAITKSGEATP